MLITTEALILQERQAGERGKFIDILTSENGVLEVFIRGKQKINAKHTAAVQVFAYAKCCLSEQKGQYYLESAEPIHLFYALREDLTRLALAAYFFDLIRHAIPSGQPNAVLRLTLNTLYYLCNGKRETDFLKSLFELRFLSELGMMPDVLMCPVCMEYLPASLFFSLKTGHFYCEDCYIQTENDFVVRMSQGGLQAIRHLVLSEMEQLFHFKVSSTTQQAVSQFAEQFLQYQLDYRSKALQFYKQLQTNILHDKRQEGI